MNRSEFSSENGFTLVEVVVTAVILVLVTSAAYGLLSGTIAAWRHSEERVDAQQRVRYAVLRMTREIREAEQVVDTRGYLFPHWYETGENALFIRKAGGKIVVFYLLENSRLLRRAVLGGTSLEGNNEVAYGISEVKFEYDAADVEKSSVVGVTVKASGEEYGLSTKAHLRLFEQAPGG